MMVSEITSERGTPTRHAASGASRRMVFMGEKLITCAHCEKPFPVDTTQRCWWSTKYCGEECRKAASSIIRRQKMADGKAGDVILAATTGPQGGRMAVITCEWCGTPREVPYEKRDTRFCAKPATCCYDYLKKPKVVLTDEQRAANDAERTRKIWEARRRNGTDKHSEKTKAKISKTVKDLHDNGHYDDVDNSTSPETREKIAESVRQRWAEGAYDDWDQSYRTPEHNARHSEAMKALWAAGTSGLTPPAQQSWTEERRQQQSARLTGKKKPPRTEEHKKNISIALQQKLKDGTWDPGPGNKPAWYWGVTPIRMRSAWEVVFADEMDRHGVRWAYEPKRFDLGWTTYKPDFYLPDHDLYIEVKGWLKESSARKISDFHNLGHHLVVVSYHQSSLGFAAIASTPVKLVLADEVVEFARSLASCKQANVKINSDQEV